MFDPMTQIIDMHEDLKVNKHRLIKKCLQKPFYIN